MGIASVVRGLLILQGCIAVIGFSVSKKRQVKVVDGMLAVEDDKLHHKRSEHRRNDADDITADPNLQIIADTGFPMNPVNGGTDDDDDDDTVTPFIIRRNDPDDILDTATDPGIIADTYKAVMGLLDLNNANAGTDDDDDDDVVTPFIIRRNGPDGTDDDDDDDDTVTPFIIRRNDPDDILDTATDPGIIADTYKAVMGLLDLNNANAGTDDDDDDDHTDILP